MYTVGPNKLSGTDPMDVHKTQTTHKQTRNFVLCLVKPLDVKVRKHLRYFELSVHLLCDFH